MRRAALIKTMNIIGKTKDGYILQAESYEVARLAGYYSESSASRSKRFEVGTTIDVNSMYLQLQKIKEIKPHVRSITAAAEDLLKAITYNYPVLEPVIEAVNESEPK